MAKRLHLWVAGRVQGVYFRESTRQEAERHGVSGWVRNLPDGRVEAVLQGDEEGVDAVAAWCRKGPAGAQVGAVAVKPEAAEAGLSGFRVLR